jgi:hypothetical protein
MIKFTFLMILFSSITYSQETIKKNLNLEDISIKGELLSDSRMNLIKRKKEELKNRVKFRTQYRDEILQEYSVP